MKPIHDRDAPLRVSHPEIVKWVHKYRDPDSTTMTVYLNEVVSRSDLELIKCLRSNTYNSHKFSEEMLFIAVEAIHLNIVHYLLVL